jgi:hypothetical protein
MFVGYLLAYMIPSLKSRSLLSLTSVSQDMFIDLLSIPFGS